MIDKFNPENLIKKIAKVQRTRFVISIVLAIIVSFIITILFSLGFYSHIQVQLSDYLYGGDQPLDNIVIVAIDDHSIQEIGRWPWGRGNFTNVMQYFHESQVVGFDIAFFEYSHYDTDIELAEAVSKSQNVIMPVEYVKFQTKNGIVLGLKAVEPIKEIFEASKGYGYINIVTDVDGITRSINTNIQGSENHIPFSYAVLNQYIKKTPIKKDRMNINFVGPPGSYKYYSFIDVLNGNYDSKEFENKIVLIGATAPDLHDDYLVPTSYGKAMPGVEIHANIIQQLLMNKHINNAPDWITVTTILLCAIAVALLVFYLSVWMVAIIAIVAIVLYIFLVIFAFDLGIILNIVYVPVTILITYLSEMILYYVSEKKSRKQVLGAFEKYVSKDVITHILDNPEKLTLGGEKRKITVFFSDIRGFTTISEKLTPEQLVHLLNEYLTEMTNIILKHNGVVDKYMGDAIMAFWNAPLNQPKHAVRASLATLEMEKRLKELQKKWKKEGVPHLEIGCGLNTGYAVVGNMGSYERFDYTAMGDTVNLGSRLEGINKPYGTRIIISETTKEELMKEKGDESFVVRKLDMVQVKGKNKPITIYELVTQKKDAKDWYYAVILHFEKGLKYYFNQDWTMAIKEFKEANKIRYDHLKTTGDGPSKTFIERCEYFKKNPPGKDWNGVWVMKTK